MRKFIVGVMLAAACRAPVATGTAAPGNGPYDLDQVEGVSIAAGPPGVGPGAGEPLPDDRRVVVQIPHDYHALLALDIERARVWRQAARRAFLQYFALGYRVSAFVPGHGNDARYLLSLPD